MVGGVDVAVGDGGTGASTTQTAIDTLTSVSGATNEHVLTKDTATGNAIFKTSAVNISDIAYDATSWNGVTTIAPSKNAVRDVLDPLVNNSVANTLHRHSELVASDGSPDPAVSVDSAGRMTNSSQPAFSAVVNTLQSNVTGDGTIYSIIGAFWTERFDQGSNFSDGTFTSPVTGKYLLTGVVYTFPTGAREVQLRFFTSNQGYTTYQGIPTSYNFTPAAIIVDMDASDTAYLQVKVTGGAKDVEVGASYTIFTGALIC